MFKRLSITVFYIMQKENALNVLTLSKVVPLIPQPMNIYVITHILLWLTIVDLESIFGTFLMMISKHVILKFYSAVNKVKINAQNVVMDILLLKAVSDAVRIKIKLED